MADDSYGAFASIVSDVFQGAKADGKEALRVAYKTMMRSLNDAYRDSKDALDAKAHAPQESKAARNKRILQMLLSGARPADVAKAEQLSERVVAQIRIHESYIAKHDLGNMMTTLEAVVMIIRANLGQEKGAGDHESPTP